jgi:hypothetical protein
VWTISQIRCNRWQISRDTIAQKTGGFQYIVAIILVVPLLILFKASAGLHSIVELFFGEIALDVIERL